VMETVSRRVAFRGLGAQQRLALLDNSPSINSPCVLRSSSSSQDVAVSVGARLSMRSSTVIPGR
jgi:hypothetical protein